MCDVNWKQTPLYWISISKKIESFAVLLENNLTNYLLERSMKSEWSSN